MKRPTACAALLLLSLAPAACGSGNSSAGGGPDAGSPPDGGSQEDTPPEFSGASSATGLSSAIRIEWSPASDDTTAAGDIVYLVYEAETSGGQDFASASYTTSPGVTSFTVPNLPVSATRYYVVRAQDRSGNVDDNAAEVSATTLATADETPPEFGGLDSASPSGSTAALLSWSPASDDVTPPEQIRYRAYLATSSGGQDFGSPAAESDPGATELLVSGLSPETTYYFVVRAVDGNENEESNTVERSATTAAPVSFSGDVQPIFTANCTSNACHGGAMPSEDLDLTEGSAYGELVGVASAQCADRLLVAAGDPGASYLVDKLMGTNLCFGSQMPKGGSLSAAEIQTVVDWIAQGAPEN